MTLRGKHAVIIDDDKNFRILLKSVLENAGLFVRESSSVKSAFQDLQDKVPHLIFLDMNMPEESGLQFLERKSKNPILKNVPVLVLTAHSEKELVYRALLSGATEYLLKPLNSEILLKKVRKIVKDKEFFHIDIDQSIRCQVSFQGELIGVGPSGMFVASSVKLLDQQRIHLTGRIGDVFNRNKFLLESDSKKSHFSGSGKYISWLNYSDLTQKEIGTVTKVSSRWNQIVSSHPKEINGITFPEVLIIDDDENFNLLIRKVLSKLGIKSETFTNSKEFLSRLSKGKVDACFIDLNLDIARFGFTLVQEIRRSVGPYLPLFVISGEDHEAVIAEALEMGCNGYIVKSVDMKTLSDKLAKFLFPKVQLDEKSALFQPPSELSHVQLHSELELIEVDELGVKFTGTMLPAKGTILTILPIHLSGRDLASKPISFTVTQTWVNGRSHPFSFYAEPETGDLEYGQFLQALAGVLSQKPG
jgi:CheY-like chemotaxis protein